MAKKVLWYQSLVWVSSGSLLITSLGWKWMPLRNALAYCRRVDNDDFDDFQSSADTGRNIYSYYSIPYGQPTSGDRRFAPPEFADPVAVFLKLFFLRRRRRRGGKNKLECWSITSLMFAGKSNWIISREVLHLIRLWPYLQTFDQSGKSRQGQTL